jgi:hypothetical protein
VLEWFDVEASSRRPPHAKVSLRTPEGQTVVGDFTGDGPIDAIFRAINAATQRDARLRDFRIDSVTGGQDALGQASVVIEIAGVSAAGQGVSTDIIEAAALAYVARAPPTPSAAPPTPRPRAPRPLSRDTGGFCRLAAFRGRFSGRNPPLRASGGGRTRVSGTSDPPERAALLDGHAA